MVRLQPNRELTWSPSCRGTGPAGGTRATDGPVQPDATDGVPRPIAPRPPVDTRMAPGTARLLGLPIPDNGLQVMAFPCPPWPPGGPRTADPSPRAEAGLGRRRGGRPRQRRCPAGACEAGVPAGRGPGGWEDPSPHPIHAASHGIGGRHADSASGGRRLHAVLPPVAGPRARSGTDTSRQPGPVAGARAPVSSTITIARAGSSWVSKPRIRGPSRCGRR